VVNGNSEPIEFQFGELSVKLDVTDLLRHEQQQTLIAVVIT
jgi:hypothetical protein